MLIKEVFLYRMKHISRILTGIILLTGLFFRPSVGYADNLAQALNENVLIQSEQDNSLTQKIQDEQEDNTEKPLRQVKKKLKKIKAERKAREEARRKAREKARLENIGAPVVNAAYSTSSPGAGLCAAWVSHVYRNAGRGRVNGNACDQYWAWCKSTDRDKMVAGMIIAVPSHTRTSAGITYGHVGILVKHDGRFYVRHNIGSIVEDPIDEWIAFYGTTYQPAWGFANGIG